MPSLKEIFKIGVTREARRTTICAAINQMRTLEFYYHGGYRTVEPFALGIVLPGDDNESLICYQTGGFSDLKDVVGWKLYRAKEMQEIVILRDKFNGERPNYDPDNIGMWQVICSVRPVRKTGPTPEEPPVLATETEPVPPSDTATPTPTIVRYLTHNELMARFRYAHPTPIPELHTRLWPEPLAVPFSSPPGSEPPPDAPMHYLVGQPV